MYIHRKDVKIISDIMAEFPEARSFRLDCKECDGIGDILMLTVMTKVFGKDAEVTFEITGVKDW
jgi:hypothetical protein